MSQKLYGTLLVCILISSYIIYLFGNIVLQEWKNYNLLRTQGKIISAEVGSAAAVFDVPTSGALTSVVYFPKIRFEYEVNGKILLGDHYSITMRKFGSMKRVQNIVKKYTVGSQVTVWYDKKNPAIAVLEKKLSILAWTMTFFACLGFATCTFYLLKRIF